MMELPQRALTFLQKKFPAACILQDLIQINHVTTGELVQISWALLAIDPDSGTKQRLIAISNLSDTEILSSIAKNIESIFSKINDSFEVGFDNVEMRKGHPIDSAQMVFSPRIILYTDNLPSFIEPILNIFGQFGILADIANEADMFKSIFISYGGPDETAASNIYDFLKSRGIKTWFFPEDALPGQKLHRVMHEGVKNHDRVLLICSQNSLSRPGVLNELERVLEREAKEGGSGILVPITLDDFVYSNWAPEREDLAEQVRTRVISKLNANDMSSPESQKILEKLVQVLKN